MPEKKEMHKRARDLRKAMTTEERHLYYDYFKHLSITVRRQMSIGMYIADFYVSEAKLIVELDGSQHYEEAGRKWDDQRDSFLRSQGIKVLRFSNADINQRFRAVCECISLHIEERIKEKLNHR